MMKKDINLSILLILIFCSLQAYGQENTIVAPRIYLDSAILRTDVSQRQLNFIVDFANDSPQFSSHYLWVETYYGLESHSFKANSIFSLDTIYAEKARLFYSTNAEEPEARLSSLGLYSDSVYYFRLYKQTIIHKE